MLGDIAKGMAMHAHSNMLPGPNRRRIVWSFMCYPAFRGSERNRELRSDCVASAAIAGASAFGVANLSRKDQVGKKIACVSFTREGCKRTASQQRDIERNAARSSLWTKQTIANFTRRQQVQHFLLIRRGLLVGLLQRFQLGIRPTTTSQRFLGPITDHH